ncbi:MAG: hypothetical protein RR335_05025, partial [Eubacterium sp.]
MSERNNTNTTGVLGTIILLFLMIVTTLGINFMPVLAAPADYTVTVKEDSTSIVGGTIQFVPALTTTGLEAVNTIDKKTVIIDEQETIVFESTTNTEGKVVFPGITEYLNTSANTDLSGYYRIINGEKISRLEEVNIPKNDATKTTTEFNLVPAATLDLIAGYSGTFDNTEHDLIDIDATFPKAYSCEYREKGTSAPFVNTVPKGTNVAQKTYEIKVSNATNQFTPTIIERMAEIKQGSLSLEFIDEKKNPIIKLKKQWFDDAFTVQVEGTPAIMENEIVYSINDPDVADISGNQVTLKKAGTAKIIATYIGDAYSKATAELTLEVEKALPGDIGLNYDSESKDLIYNISKTFKPKLSYKVGIKDTIKSKVQDYLTFSNSSIDGTITYDKEGEISVTANLDKKKSGFSDYFEGEVSTTYNGMVKYLEQSTVTPSINTDKAIYNNGNYYCYGSEGFIITAPTTPETYSIAKSSSNPLTEKDFGPSITFVNSETNGATYVLKNTLGQITAPKTTTEKFGVDTVLPEIKISENPNEVKKTFEFKVIGQTSIEKAIHFLSFGTFFNEKIEVTVHAFDAAPSSNIKEIKLFLNETEQTLKASELKNLSETTTATASATFEIPLTFKGTVSATVTDNANNVSQSIQATASNSNMKDAAGNIMLEDQAPVTSTFSVEQINGVNKDPGKLSPPITIDGKDFITGDSEIKFTTQDLESGLSAVQIYYNDLLLESKELDKSNAVEISGGTQTTYPQTFNTQDLSSYKYTINTKSFTPSDEGLMKFKVVITDNAGNVSTIEEKQLYKDITAATVTDFKFTSKGNNDKPVNVETTDYGYYFKEDTEVTITATDDKYSKDQAISGLQSITYVAESVEKDADGNQIRINGVENVNKNNQITFKITKDFKGQIYAYATDKLRQSAVEVVSGIYKNAGLQWPQDYEKDGNKIVIREGLYK